VHRDTIHPEPARKIANLDPVARHESAAGDAEGIVLGLHNGQAI
jgi:hypothetical protein